MTGLESTSAKEASVLEADAAAFLTHIHRLVLLKTMKVSRPIIMPSIIMITMVRSSLILWREELEERDS